MNDKDKIMVKKIVSTKRIEIYLSEPDKEIRNQQYRTLRDYSYNSRKMANFMMDIYSSNFSLENLKKEYPDHDIKTIQECFLSSQGKRKGEKVSLQNLGYKASTDKFKDLLPSTIRASLSQKVNKDFSNTLKDVLLGNRNFNFYKKDFPIFFGKKAINGLQKEDGGKNFSFELFGFSFKTRLGADRSNNEFVLDSILSGNYLIRDSSIQFKNNKLFLNLVIKHDFAAKDLDENKILGVDLGIACPAYVSIFGTKVRMAIGDGKDFQHQRFKIFSMRKRLHKNLKQTSGGRGRKHKLKKLEQFSEKEKNFSKTYNHYISKNIIEIALKNGCGTINIEKLEGIAREEKNKFILRNWSYHQLITMIKYKAKKYNIKVQEIDPSYTSQRCSSCGHISNENRTEQAKFSCVKCGFEENADYNASQNICIAHTKDFVNQIKEHKKSLFKKEVAV